MKIQRTPIILFTIAALLGGVVYILELQKTVNSETSQVSSQKLFPFKEADVQAFTLKTPQQTLAFAKVPASPTSPTSPTSPPPKASPSPPASPAPSVWKMTKPEQTPASEGSIAFLLNLVGTGSSEKTVTVPRDRLAEFGLDKPQATVDLTLNSQKKHRLVLGDPDFNRSFLYAQIDPDANAPEQTVYLVSLDFENAVNRPIAEWKEPPPSPAPSPQPTASPK